MTRIQPHNIEIEEQVLGIILNNPKAFVTAINIINANCFYKNEHQTVFNAFTSLYSQSKPIDLISVTTFLRNSNNLDSIGGNFFLMELMERSGSYTSFEFFCHTLLELNERREGIEKSSKLINSLYDLSTDLDENMVMANEVVLSLSNEVSNVGGVQLSTALLEMIREQENELRGEFSGCKSRYTDLDRVIVGFKNQQVAVLAGRPGMGKTTFGINIAYRLAKYDKTAVGFFSLEMSSVELTKKFAAIESQICNSRMTMLPEKQVLDYFSAIQSIGDLPIFIDDKPGATIDEIRARAITMKRKHDVKLIVIDYLQLITTKSKGGNREQEISEISRKVKLLAKELNIPIIAISQLSRQVEQSDPKVPFLHHLRESGSIEQDADMVLMLWRPEYYDYPEFEYDGKMVDSRGMVVTYVRKNRNGETGKALMKCNLAYASFYDNNVDNFMLPNYDF
jgi:replicative DNA helicase